MIYLNKLYKLDLLKILIIISYIVIWLSISTNFDDLKLPDNLEAKKINIYVNFFRQFFLCTFFIINILLFLNIIYKKNNFKYNILFLFFFIYILSQIPGLILTENSFKNISYLISSCSLLILINLINNYFNDKEKIIFILISLFLLLLVYCSTFIPNLIFFLKGQINLYGGYQEGSEVFLGKHSPRSSGTSRSALIISLYLMIISSLYDLFKNYKFLLNILLIILFTSIITMQSRTNIFLLSIVIFYYYHFQNNIKTKMLIKYSLTFILTPILLSLIIFSIYGYTKLKTHNDIKKYEKYQILSHSINKPLRKIGKKNFTSGRLQDWTNLFQSTKNKILLGYGAQGDRFLINQSASNGLLYVFSSSGLMGILFYSLFSITIFIKIIKNLLLKNNYKLNPLKFFNSIIIFIILLRSMLESSYAVFGIDQIVLFTSLIFINKSRIKI